MSIIVILKSALYTLMIVTCRLIGLKTGIPSVFTCMVPFGLATYAFR